MCSTECQFCYKIKKTMTRHNEDTSVNNEITINAGQKKNWQLNRITSLKTKSNWIMGLLISQQLKMETPSPPMLFKLVCQIKPAYLNSAAYSLRTDLAERPTECVWGSFVGTRTRERENDDSLGLVVLWSIKPPTIQPKHTSVIFTQL